LSDVSELDANVVFANALKLGNKFLLAAEVVEPTEAVVFKGDALRNKAKETPAFGYDLALRVGAIMMQQLQSTRIRLLDICEVTH